MELLSILNGCDVSEFLNTLSVLLVIGSLISLLMLLGTSKNFPGMRQHLPGPRSWPLIGSLFEIAVLGQNCNDNEFCRRLCQKYGSIVGFKVGAQNFVVTEDVDVCKHIFTSDDWGARIPTAPLFLEYFVRGKKLGILFNDGDEYKETHRFTLRCLKEFGFGQLHAMGRVIKEEADHFIENFETRHVARKTPVKSRAAPTLPTIYEALDENNNFGKGCPMEFSDITLQFEFNLPALNVLWRYVCGTRFDPDDPVMLRLHGVIEATNAITQYVGKPIYAFPFLRFLPFTRSRRDQQLTIQMFNELRSIFQDVVAEKKKSGAYKLCPQDFIDMYLNRIDEATENRENSKIYTMEQLIQTCTDMALAGSDTTGNSIEYSILYMLSFPEVQRAVQQEIDSVIGNQRRPTIHDRSKLPYTEATTLEVLRCANVLAFDYRATVRDTELCGAPIPKNTMALVNMIQVHKDKKLWDDPEEFRPSRFLSPDMEIINTNKLFAFGGGKRICIGKSMAKATLFVFFATLLQRYTFEPSVKHPDFSIHNFCGGFSTRPQKFHCTVKRRHAVG